ncbi:hypothetical protein FDA94_29035 [Herbidospora galbida]|uniref:Uncharacterized protein n=1 Tax=Herbidospora galbida TaxID=2575442 RepID=A0A4U3M772_9ACTN|nr:hypothetical protein [Herbidospora galbida]TKK84661.1 hypothetical protein FDA94_29035 [Herbidospora galbida]
MSGYKDSRRQEKRGAKLFGGTVNAGSGNQWRRKNDVRSKKFSIEYKTTGAKSYRITKDELLQAEKHALLDGRTMLFGIEIGGRNWILLAEEDFIAELDLEEDPQ